MPKNRDNYFFRKLSNEDIKFSVLVTVLLGSSKKRKEIMIINACLLFSSFDERFLRG